MFNMCINENMKFRELILNQFCIDYTEMNSYVTDLYVHGYIFTR